MDPVAPPVPPPPAPVEVRDLTLAFGDRVIQEGLSFAVRRGSIFAVMGGSGCGKSTLIKHMLGLLRPAQGEILYGGEPFVAADETRRARMLRDVGVLYQGGALWTSLTLGENVSLPLEEQTALDPGSIRELVSLKLRLVGLAGFEDYYPSELSGGMRKRAGLARALALDPGLLYLDEPSAGLDPVSSHRLDELILGIRDGLGATVVVVTHELPSIFAIADDAVLLDATARTIVARGAPRQILAESDDPRAIAFLTRGEGRPNWGAPS